MSEIKTDTNSLVKQKIQLMFELNLKRDFSSNLEPMLMSLLLTSNDFIKFSQENIKKIMLSEKIEGNGKVKITIEEFNVLMLMDTYQVGQINAEVRIVELVNGLLLFNEKSKSRALITSMCKSDNGSSENYAKPWLEKIIDVKKPNARATKIKLTDTGQEVFTLVWQKYYTDFMFDIFGEVESSISNDEVSTFLNVLSKLRSSMKSVDVN